MRKEVVEVCPHCDSENILQHDVEKDGFVIKCNNCGKEIFLCDECLHRDDNSGMKCDWQENGTCFRGCCHN